MPRPLPLSEIGFGKCARRFSAGGRDYVLGEVVPQEVLKAMRTNNRNALIENHYITVYPPSVAVRGAETGAPRAAIKGDAFLVERGFGKYDVIQGVKLADGVAKAEAEAIISGLSETREPKAARVAPAKVKKPLSGQPQGAAAALNASFPVFDPKAAQAEAAPSAEAGSAKVDARLAKKRAANAAAKRKARAAAKAA